MTAEALVTLDGVSKEYETGPSTVHALREVTLSLPAGVLCVVHGRSGSGKTTLLNMIGGLDRPTAGRVEVDGREVSSLGEDALVEYRRDVVGFVFQAFGLLPILTAAENVEVPLRLRRTEPAVRDARVHELLHLVDLGDRANHRPPELSGGEQQRVAIARALGNDPHVLIADEPTGQLDSHRAQMVMALMAKLVEERNVLAIVATHDPLLIEMADRLVELRDGMVVGEERRGRVAGAASRKGA
jgi:putative ABC transport system ATP-binding protein